MLFLAGCAGVTPARPPVQPAQQPPRDAAPTPPPPQHQVKQPESVPEGPDPRTLAAWTLTRQAKALINNNRPDDAIRVLERAVNLHPQLGENYYYLAAAWLIKGNVGQALEFNRLAEIYLKNDPQWMHRVKIQQTHIR